MVITFKNNLTFVKGKRFYFPNGTNTCLCQEVEGLLEEVQEARRIKLLHQPSKVCFKYAFLYFRSQSMTPLELSLEVIFRLRCAVLSLR